MEKDIKANTSKTRTYSSLRQSVIYCALLASMHESGALPLMNTFTYYLKQHIYPARILGIICQGK